MKDYWVLDEIIQLPKGHIMTAQGELLIHDGRGYWYKLDSDEGREITEEICLQNMK